MIHTKATEIGLNKVTMTKSDRERSLSTVFYRDPMKDVCAIVLAAGPTIHQSPITNH